MGIIEIEKETEERGVKPQVTEISEWTYTHWTELRLISKANRDNIIYSKKNQMKATINSNS